jgi:hypothetical protein
VKSNTVTPGRAAAASKLAGSSWGIVSAMSVEVATGAGMTAARDAA